MYQSACADEETALVEHVDRDNEIIRQSEELVHRLARLVQGVDAEVPRVPEYRLENPSFVENIPWTEIPSSFDPTGFESFSNPWDSSGFESPYPVISAPPTELVSRDPAFSPDGFFNPGQIFHQPTGFTCHEPIDHGEILRRAERAVQVDIARGLREPLRGPVHRAHRTASMLVGTLSQSGVGYRRITISERELQFFAMRREVERLQEEIDLICSGGDNTNDSEKNRWHIRRVC